MEDYTKYLSVDNGHGVLISQNDAYLLDQYKIDYLQCSTLKELIMLIEECLDENPDEELESVIDHLSEVYYYQHVNK